ncbi:helitron_like_N domain-containing protein [Trichonephila inaurata madagascariensis]|uniref:Helitron_like_N domain-containing protein n=1 Tax=Trichonephila inaurata madagascariensis TaxID=2747483 RepID=A0A8X6YW24_9ARAC|nr:helitron_like_N domain-containing protein [Trichonephila inaurata madagascariensis]
MPGTTSLYIYFLTFSCNDLNWLDVRKVLLIADGRPKKDPNELDIYATKRLMEIYPVVVSRHFMIRVNALVTFMLNIDEVFGGKVEDYWWRIEFQNRGSPHLHMVVWIDVHRLLDTPEALQRIDHAC